MDLAPENSPNRRRILKRIFVDAALFAAIPFVLSMLGSRFFIFLMVKGYLGSYGALPYSSIYPSCFSIILIGIYFVFLGTYRRPLINALAFLFYSVIIFTGSVFAGFTNLTQPIIFVSWLLSGSNFYIQW